MLLHKKKNLLNYNLYNFFVNNFKVKYHIKYELSNSSSSTLKKNCYFKIFVIQSVKIANIMIITGLKAPHSKMS